MRSLDCRSPQKVGMEEAMSEHDIADCPGCQKRCLVLKENGEWMCLDEACKYHKKGLKMPQADAKAELVSIADLLNMLVAAVIVALFMMVAMGV